MPEDLMAEPVWPDTPATDTETDSPENPENGEPKGEGGTDDIPDAQKKEPEKAKEAEPGKTDEKKDEQKPAELSKEPLTRGKKPIDFILERKQKQLEKAKANRIAKINQDILDEGGEIDDDDDDDDDSIAPEDRDALRKVVDKTIAPLQEKIAQQEFEKEVTAFVSENKIAKLATPTELESFKTYAQHPSRKDVPFETIILEVLGFERIAKIGAEMEKQAAKEAGASKVGASGAGKKDLGEGSLPDFDKMTDAQLEDYQNKVMGRG